ncbi:formylglycine-generating enzyme family protein [Leucobacter sp. HY1910]
MERFTHVPGGVVTLTDARRKSERSVQLAAFAISHTVITEAEFVAGEVAASAGVLAASAGLPARGMSWFDVVSWCNVASARAGLESAYRIQGRAVHWTPGANGFRLPTEAEWVWAARGGTAGPRYGALAEVGWCALDGVAGPQPVGLKLPNAFGVYDALGNVWEWCWDRLDPARYGDYRVFKGGGWADPAWSCRVGVRRGNAPDARVEDVGLRVVRGPVRGDVGSGDVGSGFAQGWSERADRERAAIAGPLPVGWTPLAVDCP